MQPTLTYLLLKNINNLEFPFDRPLWSPYLCPYPEVTIILNLAFLSHTFIYTWCIFTYQKAMHWVTLNGTLFHMKSFIYIPCICEKSLMLKPIALVYLFCYVSISLWIYSNYQLSCVRDDIRVGGFCLFVLFWKQYYYYYVSIHLSCYTGGWNSVGFICRSRISVSATLTL